MKTLLICSIVLFAISCSSNKQDEPRKIKEIVCGDSIDQKLYIETGEEYTMRVPGKCDTIYESAEE